MKNITKNIVNYLFIDIFNTLRWMERKKKGQNESDRWKHQEGFVERWKIRGASSSERLWGFPQYRLILDDGKSKIFPQHLGGKSIRFWKTSYPAFSWLSVGDIRLKYCSGTRRADWFVSVPLLDERDLLRFRSFETWNGMPAGIQVRVAMKGPRLQLLRSFRERRGNYWAPAGKVVVFHGTCFSSGTAWFCDACGLAVLDTLPIPAERCSGLSAGNHTGKVIDSWVGERIFHRGMLCSVVNVRICCRESPQRAMEWKKREKTPGFCLTNGIFM